MRYTPREIKPSGATYDQLKAGGATGLLERLVVANSEGWTALDYQLVRSAKNGDLEDVYRRLRRLAYDFNYAETPDAERFLASLARLHNVFAILSQLCMEIGDLVAERHRPAPTVDATNDEPLPPMEPE